VLRTKVDPQPSLFECCSLRSSAVSHLGFPPSIACSTTRCSSSRFVAYFDPCFGRPSIPIETYLRLMHLRFRYRPRLRDSVAPRWPTHSAGALCRIGPYEQGAGPSTLMKITKRCGDDVSPS